MAQAGAAHAAIIANAIKASGTVVSVSPEDFDRILSKTGAVSAIELLIAVNTSPDARC